MKLRKKLILFPLCIIIFYPVITSQPVNVQKLQVIRLKMYAAEGLIWKNESAQNTNWNKITETPDGKIWFCGGDHWGTDETIGTFDKSDRYKRHGDLGTPQSVLMILYRIKLVLSLSLTERVLSILMRKPRDMEKYMAILPPIQKACYILPDIWECLICMNLPTLIIQKVMPGEP